MNRRSFIKKSVFASIPLTLGGFPLSGISKNNASFAGGDNDHILVLVQLQGGNDGLSTIFNAAQYDNLQAVRGNIILPKSSIINFHNDYGFHSAMQSMKEVWDTGNLGIVQNVGYPNQNRSHFRSNDIWNSASSAEVFDSTGWIGRYYDLNHSDYPTGYPNIESPHPFALTMGKILSETCQGVNSNYSLSLLDPLNPGTALVSAGGNVPNDCFGDALSFVNNTVAQTNAFATVISDAANKGKNLSPKWNSLTTELSEKLKNVARLIAGGLETKIYIVQIGGFDTHDNQVVQGATTTGIQSELLKELSDAIGAFQDDINLLRVSNRVIGMTYSEFGRRIRSNAALGTDHGTAAPLFLFGENIKNQIMGDHPIIDKQVSVDDGVAMQFDFKDIYGSILQDWLGLENTQVADVIYPEVKILPLFKSSINQSPLSLDEIIKNPVSNEVTLGIQLYPNPAIGSFNIQVEKKFIGANVTVHNLLGKKIKTFQLKNQKTSQHLEPGIYIVEIEKNGNKTNKKLIVK